MSLSRGGIVSNIDRRLSGKQVSDGERQERNLELIAGRYRDAEVAEREQGHKSPDVILGGFQEQGVYSYDPVFDDSRDAVMGRTHLPVKEYVIDTDGQLVKTLGPAAMDCVARGVFCVRCEQRQPEDDVVRRDRWRRMLDCSVHLVGRKPSEQCCFCGGQLGIGGAADDTGVMAGDQRELLVGY